MLSEPDMLSDVIVRAWMAISKPLAQCGKGGLPWVGGAAIGIFGVSVLVLLEKLEFVLGSGMLNRSLWSPSRIRMSVLNELVAVADWRKKRIVLWKSVRSSSSSTSECKIGSRKAAERTSRFPHCLV